METEAGKIRVVKAKRGREKSIKRKETRGERAEEEVKKNKKE